MKLCMPCLSLLQARFMKYKDSYDTRGVFCAISSMEMSIQTVVRSRNSHSKAVGTNETHSSILLDIIIITNKQAHCERLGPCDPPVSPRLKWTPPPIVRSFLYTRGRIQSFVLVIKGIPRRNNCSAGQEQHNDGCNGFSCNTPKYRPEQVMNIRVGLRYYTKHQARRPSIPLISYYFYSVSIPRRMCIYMHQIPAPNSITYGY